MRLSTELIGTLSALVATTLFPSYAFAQEDPSINVALRTSFGAAPYLVELLETAALENSSCYFPILDRIADGTFADLSTDQELYDKFVTILEQDGHISDTESLSSFKYALSLHAAAPRIEAHFQYYKNSVEPNMMVAQDAACPVWVLIDGQQYCSPALERAQQPFEMEDADAELPFDHILGASPDAVSSILYADITHPLFGQFHETVSRTAKAGTSSYRVRYRPSLSDLDRPLYVSGYGVELVLKRTDYIVIDDRDATKDATGEKDESEKKPEKKHDFQPLTTSELSTLGLDAASFIASSSDPMKTLLEVTGNFPKYSAQIAAHNASSDFLEEYSANREMFLPAGYNVMWMNGLQIEKRKMDPHLLLDMLRRERKLIGQLKDIGLTAAEAANLLSYETLAEAQAEDEPIRYYWPDTEEDSPIIMWMNNIEEDKRYASWRGSLQMLLQRTYPGQLPQVRRDIHNFVVPIDTGDIKDLDLAVNALQGLVKRGIPIRIGLLPLSKSSTGLNVAKISYYFLDTYGISGLMAFYENLVESKKGLSGLESAFQTTIKDREPRPEKDVHPFSEISTLGSIDEKLSALERYRDRLTLDDSTVLVNGAALPRSENWFEQATQRLFNDHRRLQMAVYNGEIADDIWAPSLFLEGSVQRRNTLVTPNDLKSIHISAVADLVTDFAGSFDKTPRIPGGEAALPSDQAHLLLVADFDTEEGRAFLTEALSFHSQYPETELMFVHTYGDSSNDAVISSKLFAAARENANLSPETIQSLISSDDKSEESISEAAKSFWNEQDILIKQIGLESGKRGLWLNGRLVGPIHNAFLAADFEAVLEFERKQRIAPVTTAITGLGLEDKFQRPLDLAKVTSIVARSLKSDIPEGIYESSPPIRLNKQNQWQGNHTMLHLPSKLEPTIQIVAAIDPASEVVQPWVPILKTLSELEGIDVKIYLNPRNRLEELPVKRFYSEVIGSAPTFDENGALTVPRASFNGVPKQTLFNLGMIVPPAWLVAPRESVYDLDNIKLSSVPAGENVDAVYELEHILIEGHARDLAQGSPPRGAQLLLGTDQKPHFADTIIMANLGYFQFKANPGYWKINLKEGRSSKIFNIDSVGAKGYAPQPGDETTSVALLSFQGATLFPRLSRKPGMEEEDVLETSKGGKLDYLGKGASFAQSALSSFGLGKTTTTKNADINIFSVASGHLYERMLNIMMVSVMRHTKHTVKFWFIEQFLSPSFKQSLPTLASHYKFSYEMVTYKWPHWLRGQKEKQREIWGYKILFLDVLFPLDLDKVIFVDADQIVRTDMMDLNRVDLHGAPYGFTPMCDSRTSMEGFRFWKQGYWKNFLDGKPYHISALYVVDLTKFRQLAAGDRLRGQYHSLSADPASLSNLDQDLPNHMQHVLPIHSLSQEWLWCETWCSDESLAEARTIDLCNNPETKEPKLERARRQVPEWTEYDEEIAGVLRGASGQGGVQEQEQVDAARSARSEADGTSTAITHGEL